jgi:putative nucleotidyltransferase with HDIG domain
LEAEFDLWGSMPVHDRRHSIEVARRYVALAPDASRDEVAAALLHDVGKVVASLGVGARVVATIVGSRGRRFSAYHDHESIGAEMCRKAGSSVTTVAMIDGTAASELVDRLRRADEI